MRQECIEATQRAIGRALNAVEVKGIEARIMQAMRQLAAEDANKWRGLTKDERLIAAGERAADDLIHEANLKARRTELQVTKTAQLLDFVRAAANPMESFDRLGDRVAFNSGSKHGVTSVEKEAVAEGARMIGKLVSDPDFIDLMKTRDGIQAVTRELHGEASGNAAAKRVAGVFHDEAEASRQRFNRAGGDIGHLESWSAPQHHSQIKVALAGLEKWVGDILPRLDRAKYMNDNGLPMTDAELTGFLGHAFQSIATDGANKVTPGAFFGTGARANRGNASRALHFNGADAFMEYQALYGDKPVANVLLDHLRGIGKDIALVEAFGPNPDHTLRLVLDTLSTEAKLADPARIGKIDKAAGRVQNLYNELAGKQMPVASLRTAAVFDALRSHLVASKLGSAFLTSFTDESTMAATAQANNLSYLDVFRQEMAALNPANPMEKRLAMRSGLALNVVLQDLNRYAADQLNFDYIGDGMLDKAAAGYSKVSKQAAHAVMKLSGLPLITEARKRAFGTVMMDSLGTLTRDFDSLAKLDAKDAAMLKAKGVDDTHWAVWRLADGEDWGGGHDRVLTAESIYAVPDDEIKAVIPGEIAAIKAAADAHVAQLAGRNAEEQGWIQNRADKFRDAMDAANRADLLALEVERAQVKADIDAYLAQARTREQMQQYLYDVEDGANADRVGSRAERTGDAASRRRGRIGEDLGQRQGNIERRIVEIEARIRQEDRDTTAHISAKAKDAQDRINDMRADLAEFVKRSGERQKRRQHVMGRLVREVDSQIIDAVKRTREQAASKLLAHVLEETDMAVVEPGVRERSWLINQQRGTFTGELVRSMMLFKSFPLAMLTRHWNRVLNGEAGNRAIYVAAIAGMSTVIGGMMTQINELLMGRDPLDITDPRFAARAFLKGGAMGIMGDFLYSDTTGYGSNSPAEILAGPLVGTLAEADRLTRGNLLEAAQGKTTRAGGEAIRFFSGLTPGANLWYLKGALNHLFIHQIQEMASPGYLPRMKARAQREFKQHYWWEPGDVTPTRAPDFTAVGGH